MSRVFSNRTIYVFSLLLIGCQSGGETRKARFEREQRLQQEMQYGKLIAIQITRRYPLWKNEAATLYVNKVGKSVALFSGRSDFEYYFGILDTTGINAYAAPGGYIFITKGALKAMANEGQLAAVLAHEIAHVNLRHILKELPPPREKPGVGDRIVAVLSAQGTVISSAMNQVVEKATKILFTTGLKKQAEFEADQVALSYTASTGYNAIALPNYLQIIKDIGQAEKKKMAYNTHPPFEERINLMKQYIDGEKLPSDRPDAKKRFMKKLGFLKK